MEEPFGLIAFIFFGGSKKQKKEAIGQLKEFEKLLKKKLKNYPYQIIGGKKIG